MNSTAVERSGVGTYLGLVKFSHSVFALPFALSSAWVAARGVPDLRTLVLIVICCVAARTAAMAFNRLVDRGIDAQNPRTAGRELPAGLLGPRQVAALVALSGAVFVATAFVLNPLAGKLSVPVLVLLLGYSYSKRFTPLAHAILGACLGLAPLGAWIAVRGSLDGNLMPPILLALGVMTWVTGFDLIYATQDAEFDAQRGLHSIPARFGIPAALSLARVAHVATVMLLIWFGVSAELGWFWNLAVAGASLLLIYEHRLVAPDDLSRVDVAFFTLNGWIGMGLFAGLVLDLALLSGAAAGH